MRRAVVLALLVPALAGCTGGDSPAEEYGSTAPPTTAARMSLRAYFLRDGKVQPVRRTILETQAVAGASLLELFGGPQLREHAELGVETALPPGTEWKELSVSDGVAHVRLSHDLSDEALAQVVYTLTQFPTVRAVEIDGRRLTRADFEAQTPAILVESPLPFDRVESPLRSSGTANTFEATFEYELLDRDGKKVAGHFVTATSGTGTRGTFEFTQPFSLTRGGAGKLVVLERSAADGSRINVVETPILI
jgi:Immunoglobulin-like domain of bacterial spore germination/Sporulation and spore germination